MKNLQSKNVLITGASSGIGEAFVHQFAALGANTIIVARSENELRKTASEIEEKYATKCFPVVLDLSGENASRILFDKTNSLGIEVDVLVNNAGFGRFGNFEQKDLKIYDSLLQLNVKVLTELSWYYLPSMKKNNFGGIINVASIGALLPVPYSAVYAGSKSYVLNFSASLYGELLGTNVTVCCLCPGRTKTKFSERAQSPIKNYDDKPYDTAENAAKIGMEAFLRGKNFAISGPRKFMISFLPRILSRSRIIKITSNEYKSKG
jgi:short-subunit dehydrogenase